MSGPNVVVTTRPREYLRAKQLLARWGTVAPTDFYNVLLLTVPDIDDFIADYVARAAEDPRLPGAVSALLPMQKTFHFTEVGAFETKARETALTFADRLEGKAFHVRMHRRGHKGDLSSQTEEVSLDADLLAELERRGAPGRITFDDPDAILDVETVGNLAGMSLWTREELKTLAFLKTD